MSDYSDKLDLFLFPLISDFKEPNILEFGVENGTSTLKFLEICNKNNGYLFSADVVDCSNVSNDPRWLFMCSRDDNYNFIKSKIPKKLDIIYLDSVHESSHVEKIFYNYFEMLKVNGYFFIDDISNLPYLKNKKRNNFFNEINNKETLNKIVEIFNSNSDLFELNLTYKSSGLAIIKKLSDHSLKKSSKIQTREKSFKNFIRLIWKNLKKD